MDAGTLHRGPQYSDGHFPLLETGVQGLQRSFLKLDELSPPHRLSVPLPQGRLQMGDVFHGETVLLLQAVHHLLLTFVQCHGGAQSIFQFDDLCFESGHIVRTIVGNLQSVSLIGSRRAW